MKTKFLLFIIAQIFLSSVALAQFPGDVFFRQAAQLVGENEPFELDVHLFSGIQVYGSIQLSIDFNPSIFKVNSVVGTTDGPDQQVCYQPYSNGIHIAAFNIDDLIGPFGTIDLLKISGSVVGDIGERSQFTILPKQALEPDGSPFRRLQGFASSIEVTAGSGAKTPANTFVRSIAGPLCPGIDEEHQNVPYRRAGAVIQLFSTDEQAKPTKWVYHTYDPLAPAESGRTDQDLDVRMEGATARSSPTSNQVPDKFADFTSNMSGAEDTFSLFFSSNNSSLYSLETSHDLKTWHPSGARFRGSESEHIHLIERQAGTCFYRLVVLPVE